MKGTVTWFNAAKGYGFIKRDGPDGKPAPDLPENDVFVHYSAIQKEGYRSLAADERVEFELIEGPKGRQATAVRSLP